MKIISTENIPIKMWLDEIEDGALEQAKNLANLPFAFHHVAIMPDSHQGFGMPIGGVLATENVVIPYAVGSDIGCGVTAVRTCLTEISIDQLKMIMGRIREQIPLGHNHHEQDQDQLLMPHGVAIENGNLCYFSGLHIVSSEYKSALKQLGTLGGGNHFIEIQKGSDGFIWIMIHSGSRNLGKKVADYYNGVAKNLNAEWHSAVPKEWDLAFLPLDSQQGKDYMKEMQYCVEFAKANRKLMMDRIKDIFDVSGSDLRKGSHVHEDGTDDLFPEFIDIAHNYAVLEHHFGKDVLVHRKGATLAQNGTVGIIPGSQGTKSYIVRGKGCKDSFDSCSHGAGRKMGRREAQRTLNLEEEKKKLDDMGVLHAIRGVEDLDEAPGSYKDIDVVMKNQEDLVDIIVELTPLGVVKG